MAWVKLDDHFNENPKLARVGPLGLALYVTGLTYCNRNLTDGFIPWSIARNLVSWEFLGTNTGDPQGAKVYSVTVSSGMVGDDVGSDFVIGLLVNAGLWDAVDGGFYVHDYLKFQPSKDSVEQERLQAAERQKRARERRLSLDTDNDVTDEVTPDVTEESRERNGVNPGAPDPVPVPVLDPDPPSASASGDAARAEKKLNADQQETANRFNAQLVGLNAYEPTPQFLAKVVTKYAELDLDECAMAIAGYAKGRPKWSCSTATVFNWLKKELKELHERNETAERRRNGRTGKPGGDDQEDRFAHFRQADAASARAPAVT